MKQKIAKFLLQNPKGLTLQKRNGGTKFAAIFYFYILDGNLFMIGDKIKEAKRLNGLVIEQEGIPLFYNRINLTITLLLRVGILFLFGYLIIEDANNNIKVLICLLAIIGFGILTLEPIEKLILKNLYCYYTRINYFF